MQSDNFRFARLESLFKRWDIDRAYLDDFMFMGIYDAKGTRIDEDAYVQGIHYPVIFLYKHRSTRLYANVGPFDTLYVFEAGQGYHRCPNDAQTMWRVMGGCCTVAKTIGGGK